MSLKNIIFKHYKGQYYRVLCDALDTEKAVPMVVYQQLYARDIYPEGFIWCRPYTMFYETIMIENVKTLRFTRVYDYPIQVKDVLERLS